jgi:hypothetical protein
MSAKHETLITDENGKSYMKKFEEYFGYGNCGQWPNFNKYL